MTFAPDTETFAKPQALLRVPVGLASPLWGLFAGAAMSGAAWWWMTRWARPQNLEAMFAEAAEAVAEPQSTAIDTAHSMVETVAQPVAEAWAEADPEPVLQALVEAPSAPEPVGGESAPISPVLETVAPDVVEPAGAAEAPAEAAAEPAPAPKPKKKSATAAKSA